MASFSVPDASSSDTSSREPSHPERRPMDQPTGHVDAGATHPGTAAPENTISQMLQQIRERQLHGDDSLQHLRDRLVGMGHLSSPSGPTPDTPATAFSGDEFSKNFQHMLARPRLFSIKPGRVRDPPPMRNPSPVRDPPPVPQNVDRFNHDEILAIPDAAIINLVVIALRSGPGHVHRPWLQHSDCSVTGFTGGSFNHIRFVRVLNDNEVYVVKIPFAGTEGSWTQADADNLRHENNMIKHIRRVTDVPVPEIVDFSPHPVPHFGYPFTIMTKLPGVAAFNLWFVPGEIAGEVSPDQDSVPIEVKALRHTFVRSLAHVMAQLQKVVFPSTGVPDWSEDGLRRPPKMIARHIWDFRKQNTANNPLHERYEPCRTPAEYFSYNIKRPMHPTDDPVSVGGLKILKEMILPTSPFTDSRRDPSAIGTPHSFVLAHSDLDLQNILVDNEGNVTGIIDWDNCQIVPRSIGYASLPLFLRQDWLPDYGFDTRPWTFWTLDEYKETYIQAMMETGCPDARYTRKSGIYHAVRRALYEGDRDFQDAIQKILLEIPEFRKLAYNNDILYELARKVGRGNVSLLPFMAQKIRELMEPDVVPNMTVEPPCNPYTGPQSLVPRMIHVEHDFVLGQRPLEEGGWYNIYVVKPPNPLSGVFIFKSGMLPAVGAVPNSEMAPQENTNSNKITDEQIGLMLEGIPRPGAPATLGHARVDRAAHNDVRSIQAQNEDLQPDLGLPTPVVPDALTAEDPTNEVVNHAEAASDSIGTEEMMDWEPIYQNFTPAAGAMEAEEKSEDAPLSENGAGNDCPSDSLVHQDMAAQSVDPGMPNHVEDDNVEDASESLDHYELAAQFIDLMSNISENGNVNDAASSSVLVDETTNALWYPGLEQAQDIEDTLKPFVGHDITVQGMGPSIDSLHVNEGISAPIVMDEANTERFDTTPSSLCTPATDTMQAQDSEQVASTASAIICSDEDDTALANTTEETIHKAKRLPKRGKKPKPGKKRGMDEVELNLIRFLLRYTPDLMTPDIRALTSGQ